MWILSVCSPVTSRIQGLMHIQVKKHQSISYQVIKYLTFNKSYVQEIYFYKINNPNSILIIIHSQHSIIVIK